MARQRIWVFQQHGSGENKIAGIEKYGNSRFQIEVLSIDETLAPLLDETDAYLPQTIAADLVLDFLTHPDLSYDLGRLCTGQGVMMVASGKKLKLPGVFTPPT